MKKNVVKFGVGVLGIVILGSAVWYGVLLYQERNSPEYALKQEYEKLMEQYRSDIYGGNTPEETLRLFIDALKAGDTDLAAKYFVVDKQEEWKENLRKLAEKQILMAMVSDFQRKNYKSELTDDLVSFEIANDNNEVALTINIGRGPSGKWKIIDL